MTSSPMPETDASLLERQHAQVVAVLDKNIPTGVRIAILQFPWDGNVGCHMMWLAIIDYLRARGQIPSYVANQWDFDVTRMKEAIGDDGVVLFLGGVTVSRLWPGHAAVKRVVASACPGNRLISLPSTMLFVDDEDRIEASTMFGDHPDVIMMARDPVSAASARQVFPAHVSIVTCHDTTFLLAPLPGSRKAPKFDIIWLARGDHETTGARLPDNLEVFDWPDLDRNCPSAIAARASMKLRQYAPIWPGLTNWLVNASYLSVTRDILARAHARLDEGRVLVTDRLHPHILALLRTQPCVLLPDKYGKNRAVWEFSSHAYSTLHWADSPGEALAIARDLASSA